MADEETKSEQTEETEQQEKPKFENKVTIEDSGPCKKKVCIEVPAEAIKATLDEQYQDLRKEAIVPGFRKGRAPLRLLEKRFGTDVGKQVKLKLLAEASEAALKDNELDTLGEPDIDHEKVELPEEGPMKFEFEVEVRPEFDLPELKGIAVEKPKVETTDAQIDDEISGMRKRAGIWTPKEGGKVAEGDQVVADVELFVEGKAEHEKLNNIEIFARKNGFVGPVPVENLDTVLKDTKAGDEKKVTVEVPETFFNEQYRGKKVEAQIGVQEIKSLVPAEMNEDFFKRYGVENEDELRDTIREAREGQAEQQARNSMTEQIYKYLLDKTEFDLPANVVADQSNRILQRQYVNMLMQGIQKEQIQEQMDALRASSEEQAVEQLKVFFIMDKIAEKFDVSVTEEEINGHIAQVAASRGRRPEKMREELARDGSLAQFSLQIREQKCIEKMLESANVTEIDGVKPKAVKAQKAVKKTAKKKTTKKAEPKESDKEETKKSKAKTKVKPKRTPPKKTDKKEK